MEIRKAAILGAGTMGSGIAAHLANAGVEVMLLDIVPGDAGDDRSRLARQALERMKKSGDPKPFMHKSCARRVTPGNLEDHLDWLGEADWILEAVVERLDVKQDLYAKLEAHRKPGGVVSSNTSTIPLAKLVAGRSDAFRRDFCITHFFNPPRFMRLLELVAGPESDRDKLAALRDFCDRRLGKGVVDCKDSPGFIANRIGTYWIQAGILTAMDMGLGVEEADAVASRPFGVPKTGIFGLMDLVGLDLMPHLSDSLLSTLPGDDPYVVMYRTPELVERMIAQGYTGRKGKGGFFALRRDETGGRVKQAIDLDTGEYHDVERPRVAAAQAGRQGMRATLEHDSRAGRYAWAVMSRVWHYAASLVGEIADDIAAIDEAMRLGYGWKKGPFEQMDAVGTGWLAARFEAEGWAVPEILETARDRGFYKVEAGRLHHLTRAGDYAPIRRPEGVLKLSDIQLAAEPVARNGSAALWDIGDGVLCLEFRSKMNAIDEDIFKMYGKALRRIGDGTGDWKALVIHNEADNFSVGANLGVALYALNIGLYPQIEQFVESGQETHKALKYAPFPVVGAPSGMALGGGCEILLHCDAIQAHAETYAGLVEAGVGIVPGWGGCKEMITRHSLNDKRPGGPMPPVRSVFETVAMASVAKSAMEARDYLFLREGDGITMNKDRLLHDAKQKALELARDYRPPEPAAIHLPGRSGQCMLDSTVADYVKAGKATPHDATVARGLSRVITGGDTDILDAVDEDRLLELEREQFMVLARTEPTMKRMEHMLETGKPLRN